MKKFADFGIKPFDDCCIFSIPVISIEDVINCEVEVLDYQAGIKTRHGENRYIVKIKVEGREEKFFTTAKPIKEALDKIPKDEFPFLTIIKQQRYGGSNKTFYFS